jgi:hypothetical protein
VKKNFLFMSNEQATVEDYKMGLDYVGEIFGTNIWQDKLIAGR